MRQRHQWKTIGPTGVQAETRTLPRESTHSGWLAAGNRRNVEIENTSWQRGHDSEVLGGRSNRSTCLSGPGFHDYSQLLGGSPFTPILDGNRVECSSVEVERQLAHGLETIELEAQNGRGTRRCLESLNQARRRVSHARAVGSTRQHHSYSGAIVEYHCGSARGSLEDIVREFRDVFAVRDSELGATNQVYHHINTGDSLPSNYHHIE